MARKHNFDSEAFYAALDGERRSRQLTWKVVASEAGVGASTLSRMSQGKLPDIDSVAAMLAWSGLDVRKFMRGSRWRENRLGGLAMISTYLYSDPQLSREAAIAIDEIIKATYSRLRKTKRSQQWPIK